MKALKLIKNIIVGILGVAFFVFALSMTILLLNFNKYGVTQFDDTSLIIIKNKISSEKYVKGDLVLVKQTDITDLKVSDEIFVYKVDKKGAISIDLGTIGEVYPNDDAISFENGATFSMDYVAGKATNVYNTVGGYLSVIESKWGFLFIVLLPSFLIFIYELYALIIEIKYGKDEVHE